MVWKDKKGRTKVHRQDCEFFGSSSKSSACFCPSRLAAGTVDSIIGKLRSIFDNLDRSGEWDDRLGWGNPATHSSVKNYLKSVQSEQSEARVAPKQSTPVFLDKFRKITLHLRMLLTKPSTSAISKYIYARDLAFFTLQFFTGQRAWDLGRLKTVDVLQNPDGNTLLILQAVGKTLRGSSSRPFAIRPCKNPVICPVENLKFYKHLCSAMRIALSPGYLFLTTTKKNLISDTPFLASAAQARLVLYLRNLDIYERETVHGFRGGAAILLSLLGASKEDIAQHIGWASSHMVDHYTQLDKVATAEASEPAQKLYNSTLPLAGSVPAEVLCQKFRVLNNLVGFSPFFK